VAQTNNIPTLASLALQYGTIDNDQYRHLTALHLLGENHIIRKRGEEFGKIAIEKGFATQIDVKKAIKFQKKEFKRARVRKLIGDILVESRVITTKQKNNILREQILLEQRANNIFSNDQEKIQNHGNGDNGKEPSPIAEGPALSDYEKKFLQIKVLDREFAAGVTEKGLASEREIMMAQKVQEEEFEKKNRLKILGDIMVEMEFITEEQKNIILQDQNISKGITDKGDKILKEKESAIEVTISPDKMVARVKIDKKFLPRITAFKIKDQLKLHGITHDVYPDELLQSQLNMGNLEFAAARADYSSKLAEAKNIIFHLKTNLTEQGEKRKGDPLAEQKLSQNNFPMKNIFGVQVKQESRKKTAIQCGSGTRPSRDGTCFLAAKTGIPSFSIEKKLFIHPIINVLEDADLRYGPLEAYANLSISGVLTGAYPITAGTIKAREIRGARIESIGDIKTDVGITDAIIRSQGDIHARYLHNCQIETFGNIYIKNEIFDSRISCSGKIDSPGCRIISSTLFAKQGVKLAGAGSEKTNPCAITSGGEHHILELGNSIYQEIDRISAKLEALIEKRDEQGHLSQKIFQKMVELKIFHDRAKNKKRFLAMEFKKNRDQIKKSKLKNIVQLISNFETRIEKSITSLKEINKNKTAHDKKKAALEKKIISLTPKTNAAIRTLEEKLFLFFEWTRYQDNISKIEITGKAFPGTIFSGIYSSKKIDDIMENFSIHESFDPTLKNNLNYKMEVSKNN